MAALHLGGANGESGFWPELPAVGMGGHVRCVAVRLLGSLSRREAIEARVMPIGTTAHGALTGARLSPNEATGPGANHTFEYIAE